MTSEEMKSRKAARKELEESKKKEVSGDFGKGASKANMGPKLEAKSTAQRAQKNIICKYSEYMMILVWQLQLSRAGAEGQHDKMVYV